MALLNFTLFDLLSNDLVSVDSTRCFISATSPVLFCLLITEVQIIHVSLESMKSTEGIKLVLLPFRIDWEGHLPSAKHGRLEFRVYSLQIGWSETPYRGVQIYQFELGRNGL